MSNFTYLRDADNLAKLAQIQASSTDTNYPVSNLLALPVSKQWRSAEGAISGIKLRMDFAFAQSLDTFALVGHNLTSGATITLRGGSSPDPDGSQFQSTIAWKERTAWKVLGAAESWRYWTFLLTDEANDYGFLSVSYLVAGAKTTLTFNFAPGWTAAREQLIRQAETETAVPMVGSLLSFRTAVLLSWKTLVAADRDTLDTFLQKLEKSVKPLLLLPDSSESEAYFARLVGDYSMLRDSKWSHIEQLLFREDPLGVIVKENPPFHYGP